ncbi:MAG: hypothetical protein ABIV25_15040 [Paracoccaceae bacterium]
MKLALAAVLALLAAPSFADAMMGDAAKMTCKDLMAMDSTGMMDAGKAINTAMMADTVATGTAMADTTKTTAMADTSHMAMSDEDTMKAAETACKAHPDAMVMDAMKM